MIARLVLWTLADSDMTVADLRRHAAEEEVGVFSDVPGLLFRAWISDDSTERWGAFDVWATRQAAEQPLPSRAGELIGKEPDLVEIFDLEASVSVADELDRRGLALDA